MTRFLYDTAIFAYALGADHRYRAPCRAIVARAGSGQLTGEASVELVQELAHLRLRRGGRRATVLEDVRAVAELCELHDFDRQDLPLMMTLLQQHGSLHVRDAVHAATALNRGVGVILSTDRAFDAVHGLERVDPADESAVAELAR